MNKQLRAAAISGVILCILFIPTLILSFAVQSGQQSKMMIVMLAAATVVGLIAAIIFSWGFVIIGKNTKSTFLTNTTYVLIVVGILGNAQEIYSLVYPELNRLIINIPILVVTGIITIIFGCALLKLNKKMPYSKAAGIMEMVSGICLGTIVLIPFALLLVLPITVLETLILFNAANKWKK